MKVGLTLGKFAPLHRGHQLMIETAIAEMDRVLVMIYDSPETTTVPLPVRADWIRILYPGVEVLEAWDGPAEVGDDERVKKLNEDYILKRLEGRRVTHFYSSEFYGEHVGAALDAVDRRVDADRTTFPVSGTAIRCDPFGNREFLAPEVYRDLVARVVFLGAPSTGKTTLARELARRNGTVWMPEYGREYWDAHQVDRRLTRDQLVEIAEGHRLREDELLLEANRILFVDTDATTTLQFSLSYHGEARDRLVELADEARSRYDLFFLCGDDVPYDETWDRSGSVQRAVMQKQIQADLLQRRTPFISLRGSLDERIRRVEEILAGFDRFRSLADHLSASGG